MDLDAGWSSLVGIHGGYMSALTVRGAEAVAGADRCVRTVTTSFLRTGEPGAATLVTHDGAHRAHDVDGGRRPRAGRAAFS